MHFYCINCLSNTLPLLNLNNNQFDLTAQGINYPEDLNIDDIFLSEKQVNMIQEINKAIDRGFDINEDTDDDNDIHPINCKYYKINEINEKRLNSIKHFSIMHLNIHSLEFHIEELQIVLKLINFKFDFICISESKIRKNCNPKFDLSLDGYQAPVGTPTEAAKGGVLIYAKVGIDFIPREDLNIYKTKELESYFIESINAKGKNSIIGTIYRHPCMDQNEFIDDFMQPLNDKLLNENKKIFIGGDFNFDFLNTENNETFNFFGTMMASHMLPTITIPTKINRKKNTVIDNIFTNQIHPDMLSGNLTLAISDHLPSFLIIPRDNQNHAPKQQNFYTRETKNFDRLNFLYDYFDIDRNTILEANENNVNKSLQIFLSEINKLLDKYMPLRKVTKKEYKKRFKPWITDIILDKINKKTCFQKICQRQTKYRSQSNEE